MDMVRVRDMGVAFFLLFLNMAFSSPSVSLSVQKLRSIYNMLFTLQTEKKATLIKNKYIVKKHTCIG